jgi:hypothetical protein
MKPYFALFAFFVVAALRAATPEECVKQYYAAVAQKGVTATLDLIHPDDLKVFRGFAEQFQDRFKNDGGTAAFLGGATLPDKNVDGRLLSDRGWAERLMPALEHMQDSVLQLRKTSVLETIGHVNDGDLRFVVIRWRMKMVGAEIVKLAVATTKLYEGEPMMCMPEELMQMARLLGAQLGPHPSLPGAALPPADGSQPASAAPGRTLP